MITEEQFRQGEIEPYGFRGRRACAAALGETIFDLVDKSGVSESSFIELWLSKMSRSGYLTKGGWYSPPPNGAAVLAGNLHNPSRLNFQSLRSTSNYPSSTIIDWNEAIVFVYCSNICKFDLMPCDFSTTLYFGRDAKFLNYFKEAALAARQIADVSLSVSSSKELFYLAQEIMRAAGLTNTVYSVTDTTPLDYGHSLNRIDLSELNTPSIWDGIDIHPSVCRYVSESRLFINDSADWKLNSVDAYTIEPQIISPDFPHFPKLTFHYFITQSLEKKIESSIERFFPR